MDRQREQEIAAGNDPQMPAVLPHDQQLGEKNALVFTSYNVIANYISQLPNHDNPLPHFHSLGGFFAAAVLQMLPPKYRASLIHIGCTVATKVAQSKGSKSAKTHLA